MRGPTESENSFVLFLYEMNHDSATSAELLEIRDFIYLFIFVCVCDTNVDRCIGLVFSFPFTLCLNLNGVTDVVN